MNRDIDLAVAKMLIRELEATVVLQARRITSLRVVNRNLKQQQEQDFNRARCAEALLAEALLKDKK